MNPVAVDDQDRIDREASAWLVAIEEDGLDPERQRAFDAWHASDPRHAATYAEMRETWDDIPELTDLAHLAPAANDDESGALPNGERRWRRVSFGALGAVAAAAVAFIAVPSELYRPSPRYATALAEIRSVTLPDGSKVVLGAKSEISVRFSDKARRIVLTGGEAFFDVVHNAARPFLVEAGNSIVRDIGTRFNVNLAKGSVRVSVVEGLVEVARVDDVTGATPKRLKAGQRTEMFAAAAPAISMFATAAAAPIVVQSAPSPVAWQEGRLVYDNVRLADLAADVNRYYAPGVSLANPRVGELRVTASFKTSEIPAFMTALSATLPVRAEKNGDGGFTVSQAPR